MLRLNRALTLLLLPLLAGPAAAQREPPADVELRAAYCIGVLGGRIRDEQLQSALPGPATLQERHRRAQAGFELETRRLRSYLVPRVKYLDAEALLAATARGETEVASFLRALSECRTSCQSGPAAPPVDRRAACIDACPVTDPAAPRVQACSPPGLR